MEVGKELMRQEFTEWLNQVPENFPNLILCQPNVAGGDGGGGERHARRALWRDS